jgi:hypothetical protein
MIGLMAIDLFVLLWSLNYLIALSAYDRIGAVPFGIIFSTALYCMNVLVLKWINDK